jgi:hypothetical protein
MFRTKTLFIIGAGASCELGLPAGNALRGRIGFALSSAATDRFADENLHAAVVELCRREAGDNWGGAFRRFREAAARLQAALPYAPSIDTYLDAHRGDADIIKLGKLGISHSILDAEHESALADDAGDIHRRYANQSNLAKSWYLPLGHMLNSGYRTDTVSDLFENVSFVVFNYDRCLEQFLLTSLSQYFNLDPMQAAELVSNVEIIHTYGKVGALPWQSDGDSTPFGGGAGTDLLAVASQIRTFTETVDSGVADRVKWLVQEAETLVFMGFGFLEQNMQLLTPRTDSAVRRIFATTAGFSDTDVEVIESELVKIAGRTKNLMEVAASRGVAGRGKSFETYLERGHCCDLMKNHWMRITRQ